MKKNLLKLIVSSVMSLTLIFMLPFAVSANSVGIDDKAGWLSDSQEQELEGIQQALADKTGWNIAVVVSDGYGSESPMVYTDDLYDETFGIDTDGIVFLYDKNERYLSTSGIAISYLNDSRIESILDDVDGYYYDKDDFGALKALYSDIEYYYDEGISSNSYVYDGEYSGETEEKDNFSKKIIIGIIAGIIADRKSVV